MVNATEMRARKESISHSRRSHIKDLLALLLAFSAAFSTWFYVNHIVIAHQVNEATAKNIPRGNLSDLYPRWLGARELLLHGRDPYSLEVTREIQAGYYGRRLDPNKVNDPKDQQGFAYPLYVVFLLAPTIHWPFPVVQAVYRWLLIGIVCASVFLWMQALDERISILGLIIWITLVVGSLPLVQGIKLQQLTLLVCGFLAIVAAAIVRGNLGTAGVFLALATIKPQLTAIFAAWLILWVSGDWKCRKRLALSFAVTMILLLGGSEWLLPGWVRNFYEAAGAYWNYTGGGKSWLDVALTPTLGKPAAGLMLVALGVWLWRTRRCPETTVAFRCGLGLVFAVTLVVIPTYALYNQALLIPALILIVQTSDSAPPKGLPLLIVALTAAAVLWPWVTAFAFDILFFVRPAMVVQESWSIPLWTTLALPFAVLASVLACMRQIMPGTVFLANPAREDRV